MPSQPFFDSNLFWDTNFQELDFDKHSGYIIQRVFDRGDVEDIRFCRRFYGDEKIKTSLLKVPFLSEMRLHLASAIINEPINSFRCYTKRQSNSALLPY